VASAFNHPPARAGDELSTETRVAVLFQRFGPYHHARLNAAGRLMSVWGVEACAMEDTYAWKKIEGAAAFTRVTLTDRDSGDRRWRQELQRKLRRALDEINPQAVVVPGWSSADALGALSWCMETNTPTVVMSESTAWDERRAGWKEWIKSRLVKLNSAGLAGGTPHADYLAQLGLTPDRIFKGYDIVDNGYFSAKAEEARSQKSEVRSQKSLPEKYFLASARFVEKKNLRRLIEAYARYREMAQKAEGGSQESEVRSQRSEVGSQEAEDGNRKAEVWKLVLLGDGPLKSDLCRLISDLGLQDSVLLPGFKQYDELPAYFGLAGAFVHASTTEQWGLVVNEAMASGLPVLVSSRCGCAADQVQEGVNGFQFDPGNVEELAGLMLKISAFSFQLSTFGSESRRIIAGWGPERFAGGLSDAVAAALKNPRPRAGLVDRLLLRLLLRR
jgi:glycosyltransferase involved in cell wall biosynthesis